MKKHKTFTGKVISNKMQETVIVEVERLSRHPIYKKTVKRTKHFVAATKKDAKYEVGDIVRIEETIPLSKTKHFIVIEKI